MLRRFKIYLVSVTVLTGLFLAAWHLIFKPPPPVPRFAGAEDLLHNFEVAEESEKVTPEPTSQNSADELLDAIDRFKKMVLTLPPDEAAKKWLELYDRAVILQPQSKDPRERQKPSKARWQILNILPDPAAWPMLEKLIELRPAPASDDPRIETILHFFIHTLNNNEDKQWEDINALYLLDSKEPSLLDKVHQYSDQEQSPWYALGRRLSNVATNGKEVAHFWDKLITLFEPPPVPASANAAADAQAPLPSFQVAHHFFNGANQTLEFPDLVSLIGNDQAATLIQRALVLPQVCVAVPKGIATQKLARTLALALIDKIQQPPWSLTASIEGPPLFEALSKKFGGSLGSRITSEQSLGAFYEQDALIGQGRIDEAMAMSIPIYNSGDSNHAEAVAQAHLCAEGHEDKLYDYYRARVLKGEDAWNDYFDLAGRLGRWDEALQQVRDVVNNSALSIAARNQARIHLYECLFMMDKINEGLEELDKCRDLAALSPNTHGDYPFYWLIESRCDMALVGAKICRQTGDEAGFTKRMMLVVELLQEAAHTQENLTSAEMNDLNSAVQLFMDVGQARAGEGLLHVMMVLQLRRNYAKLEAGEDDLIMSSEARDLLGFYYEEMDWDNVLVLAEKFRFWHAADLADWPYESIRLGNHPPHTLQQMVARALVEKGRIPEAGPVVDAILRNHGDMDEAYNLLLVTHKDDILAQLDALYTQDRFEKRPLIWKAIVLFQQGKLDEAEKACRQAIAIDPSDGEAGKIDRMRAYSVMAAIFEKRKNMAEADKWGAIPKAIRLSEQADDDYDSWLFTRSAKKYEEALTIFSSAYCIESRLAKRLASLGQTDEAAAHYRRAFELMPESFGRMESHCFGCEGVFEGKTAQTAAEQVFIDMQAKQPDKAQIPYLLGTLRDDEGRYDEAVAYFKKATEIDPDYINAWNKLLEMDKFDLLSPNVRDAAVLAKLRLDPQIRHGYADPSLIRHLAQYWQAQQATQKMRVPRFPDRLFPLLASRALVEKNLAAKSNFGALNLDIHLTGRLSGVIEDKGEAAETLNQNVLLESAREQWRNLFKD